MDVEAVTLRQLLAAVHPDDRRETERAVRDAIAGDGDYDQEFRVLGEEGDLRWIAAKG